MKDGDNWLMGALAIAGFALLLTQLPTLLGSTLGTLVIVFMALKTPVVIAVLLVFFAAVEANGLALLTLLWFGVVLFFAL